MEPKTKKANGDHGVFSTSGGKLAVIIIAAIVLRAAPNVYLEIKYPDYHAKNINEIEFYYDDVARSVIAGEGFVHSVNPRPETQFKFKPGTPFHFVPPLYAWWVSLLYFLFGPNVLVAKIFQSIMDASVCYFLFIIGRRMSRNDVLGVTSAALYATYPLAIYMCMTLYYQVPLNFLLCWLVVCLVGETNLRNGVYCGLITGFSALAKPVTLPFILLLPLVRMLEVRKGRDLQVWVKWSVGLMIASVIVLTPWTVRNYMIFKKFIPVQSGASAPFIQGSKDEYLDIDVDELRKRHGQDFGIKHDELGRVALANHLEHFKNEPLDYFRFLGKKFVLSWYNTEGKTKNGYVLAGQMPYLFLGAIGLFLGLGHFVRKRRFYVPGTIIYFCLIQVAIFPLVRYTLAVMPLMMALCAVGLWRTVGVDLFAEEDNCRAGKGSSMRGKQ